MTPPFEHPDCQLRATCSTCYARRVGNARLCDLAQTKPAYRDLVEHRTREPKSAPDPAVFAVLNTIRACPHRTKPACGCPSEPGTCRRDDPAGVLVSWEDCKQCASVQASHTPVISGVILKAEDPRSR